MKRAVQIILIIQFAMFFTSYANAQDINLLIQKVKSKIEKVNDYQATGNLKTNVAFLKVPVSKVILYFKKPNLLKIKSTKGISFVPKGAVSINLNNLLSSSKYTALDAGSEKIGEHPVKVVKLLPEEENSEIVLSTLYIDEKNQVILKSKTTTRDNGSYELEMAYGKYLEYGLPDKIIFSFNTKEYKLPKGVTFDFDDGSEAKKTIGKVKNRKGRAEITLYQYIINKGIDDAVFQ